MKKKAKHDDESEHIIAKLFCNYCKPETKKNKKKKDSKD